MCLKLVRSIIIAGLLLVGIGFYSINKISYAEETSQSAEAVLTPLLIITMDVLTGNISVVDENGSEVEPNTTPIHPIKTEVMIIHESHSSPGCRTICYRGTCYQRCN